MTTSIDISQALDNLMKIKTALREARAKERAEKVAAAKASAKAKAANLRAVKAQIRALMKAHDIKIEDLAEETVH